MKLHLEVLAPPQELFWTQLAPHLPPRFVLYGGTAIALRLGHRQSVDFGFFTDSPLDHAGLERALLALEHAQTLQRAQATLVVAMPQGGREVRNGDLETSLSARTRSLARASGRFDPEARLPPRIEGGLAAE